MPFLPFFFASKRKMRVMRLSVTRQSLFFCVRTSIGAARCLAHPPKKMWILEMSNIKHACILHIYHITLVPIFIKSNIPKLVQAKWDSLRVWWPHARCLRGYWQTIGYLLAQLHGLADGYEAQRADNGQQLTVEAPGTTWRQGHAMVGGTCMALNHLW